ncbi:MAG: alpha/beta hydrolase [Gammaproteobacteria bacterium]|nr:MAG: alpha/beta hydrolase [Gammaproteobacteria bacterium]
MKPPALPAGLSAAAREFYAQDAFPLDAADPREPPGAQQLRRLADEAFAPLLEQLPARPQLQPAELAGRRGCWIEARRPDPSRPIMLYLHGGAYVLGSARLSAPITAAICRAAGFGAFSLDYRLAPEHPCPAAIDDAIAAYEALLARGWPPERIVIAGDSAGGGLALALLVAAAERGLPRPAAAALISPWTDLAGRGDSRQLLANWDPVFPNPVALDACAAAYAGGRALDDPMVSPLYAELSGLPPLLIQAGSREILLSDSGRLALRAREAGDSVELEIWDGLFHCFQILPALPEAAVATERIGHFLATASVSSN